MKIKIKIDFGLLILLLLLFFPGLEVRTQTAVVRDFMDKPNFRHAVVGIKVVEVATGKNVCDYNGDMALCPASCMKLVTTAAALEILGPGYTYKTTIFTDGVIDIKGNLKGSIYINGVGDPTLGSEFSGVDPNRFLEQWLNDIRKAGVKSVSGKVISLDGLFGYEGVSPYWTWADIGNYYAPGIYGISVFDNTYRLYLRSGVSASVPEVVRYEPSSIPLKFENNLKSAANDIDSAYIYGEPFNPNRRIFGTIPQNRSFVIKGDIPDPGLFLADCLTRYLRKSGIPVAREASTSRVEADLNPKQNILLSQTVSPSLGEIIRIVNFRSNNHYAESLYRKIELDQDIAGFWKNKGLDTEALFMYDGSGLSPSDGVSAAFLTDLLVYMAKRSAHKDTFYYSLPLAGKEGTVASLFKNPGWDAQIRAKSGSMQGVLNYSGYVDQNGKRYAFTVIVNKYNGRNVEVRRHIEQLIIRMLGNP